MNVASKELCQELCEVSNWRGTDFCWDHVDLPFYVDPVDQIDGGFPAYDSGYLLRKLPTLIKDNDDEFWFELNSYDEDDWHAGYHGIDTNDNLVLIHGNAANTPENALCQLAIELFKQGVLK